MLNVNNEDQNEGLICVDIDTALCSLDRICKILMGPHDVFIKYLRINQGLTPEHYRGIRKTLGEFLCEDGLASDNVRSLLPIVDCVVIYFR